MVNFTQLPCGLVVRIQPSHGCGPGSIPGMGSFIFISLNTFFFSRRKDHVKRKKAYLHDVDNMSTSMFMITSLWHSAHHCLFKHCDRTEDIFVKHSYLLRLDYVYDA